MPAQGHRKPGEQRCVPGERQPVFQADRAEVEHAQLHRRQQRQPLHRDRRTILFEGERRTAPVEPAGIALRGESRAPRTVHRGTRTIELDGQPHLHRKHEVTGSVEDHGFTIGHARVQRRMRTCQMKGDRRRKRRK